MSVKVLKVQQRIVQEVYKVQQCSVQQCSVCRGHEAAVAAQGPESIPKACRIVAAAKKQQLQRPAVLESAVAETLQRPGSSS